MTTNRGTQAKRAAIHEAGHAVAHLTIGVPFRYVTIEPTGDMVGHVRSSLAYRPTESGSVSPNRKCRAYDQMATLLAGREAELRAFKRAKYRNGGASQDYDAACAIAMDVSGHPEEVNPLIAWQVARARAIITGRWLEVTEIADALLNRRKLSYAEVLSVATAAHAVEKKNNAITNHEI